MEHAYGRRQPRSRRAADTPAEITIQVCLHVVMRATAQTKPTYPTESSRNERRVSWPRKSTCKRALIQQCTEVLLQLVVDHGTSTSAGMTPADTRVISAASDTARLVREKAPWVPFYRLPRQEGRRPRPQGKTSMVHESLPSTARARFPESIGSFNRLVSRLTSCVRIATVA